MHTLRPLSELTFRGDQAINPAVDPETPIEQLCRIVRVCSLPDPFDTAVRLTTQQWTSQKPQDPSLPILTWKIIHTVPSPNFPQERKVYEEQIDDQHIIYLYQQNYDHLVQFDLYAGSEIEVTRLQRWFIRQVTLYRQLLGDAGAQHWRFHEAREDTVLKSSFDVLPVRSIRFHFTTATVFPTVQSTLTGVTLRNGYAVYQSREERLQRGVQEQLSADNIANLLEVTSPDGAQRYFPEYDTDQRVMLWADDQPQPAAEAFYYVRYLYFGEDPITEQLVALPTLAFS